MAIWKWLGLDRSADGADFDSLDAIERALPSVDRARRRYAACFVYILARSARADHEVTAEEVHAMALRLAEHAGAPAGEAEEAVRLAVRQGRHSGGTDDFVVTRMFDSLATHAEKLALVDALFAVTAVDASIVTVEDNEIRRVASELKIEHGDYIAIRSRHLKSLAVLRPERPPSPAAG